jgi:hypothetical protein
MEITAGSSLRETGEHRMTSANYEIAPYKSEWGQQVAELMVHLWGADVEANLAYLRWKYQANPYTRQPLAIVALHSGRVVGFRGYMALPFQIAGTPDDLIVLCPGDTCVNREHRRSGLSVKMGRAAMRAYSGKYPLFMNWSCTKPSLPGYRRLGFQALVERAYLTKASWGGALRYLLPPRREDPNSKSRIRFGRNGELLVDASSRPAEMAALTRSQEAPSGSILLNRDEAFLAWRYANPQGRYVFYYLLREDTLLGYVAVGLSPNNRRGFLLDWAGAGHGILEEITQGILRMRHFDVLSVYAFCLTTAERVQLESLGFSLEGPIPFLERRQKGRLPLLLRPVPETFSEDGFLIRGVDARRIENWVLRPIASDAV